MKLTKTLFTTFLGATIFAFPSVTWAKKLFDDQFERGIDAAGRGDHQAAFQFWKPLAEQGDANAQLLLGGMHEKGKGVKQDDIEAVKWYRRAAEQESEVAQLCLGMMYFNGRGVKQDYSEALRWLTEAAEQGNANAQSNLGMMYENGLGVPQDKALAKAWFTKACTNHHQKACEAITIK